MRRTPWTWDKVVKASEELSSGQKLVWLEIASLDAGEKRAFVSSQLLATRLGMGQDNVEQHRRALRGLGLLGSGPCPGKKLTTWWPELPGDCAPVGPRPADREIHGLAQRLDDVIRSARAGPEGGGPSYAPPSIKEGVPQSASRGRSEGVVGSAPQGAAGGVVHYAGRGVGGRAPISTELGTSSPTSLDMQRSQGDGSDRTRSRETGGQLARDGPPAGWRAEVERHLGPPPPHGET